VLQLELTPMAYRHQKYYNEAMESMAELEKAAESICSTIEYATKEYIKGWQEGCPLRVQYKKKPSEVKLTCLDSTAIFSIQRGTGNFLQRDTINLLLKVDSKDKMGYEEEYAVYDNYSKKWLMIIDEEGRDWPTYFEMNFPLFIESFISTAIDEKVENFNP
jgi:hypothetical protein